MATTRTRTTLGKVSLTPQGAYDPETTYERLDVVQHSGSSYIVLQEVTSIEPSDDGENYVLLAQAGEETDEYVQKYNAVLTAAETAVEQAEAAKASADSAAEILKSIKSTSCVNYLGISDNASALVASEAIIGYGSAIIYVKVSADNISMYDTDSYPTTSLTFTDDDGATHSYLFAGWCTDAAESCYCESFPFDTESVVYAKFVDADYLTVQCYVTNNDGVYTWRFVTSLDSLYYNEAGFEALIDGAGEAVTLTQLNYYSGQYTIQNATTKVDASADGTSSDTTTYETGVVITPEQIHEGAASMVTAKYTDVSEVVSWFLVTPYWVTTDGTTVYGTQAMFVYTYPTESDD